MSRESLLVRPVSLLNSHAEPETACLLCDVLNLLDHLIGQSLLVRPVSLPYRWREIRRESLLVHPVSLLITHAEPVHVTSLKLCTHDRLSACHDRDVSRCTYRCTLPLACGVRDGARIHCWLVSRVVGFPCGFFSV